MLRKSSEQKALDLTLIKTSDAHKKFAFSTPVKVLENWEDDAEIKQIVNWIGSTILIAIWNFN